MMTAVEAKLHFVCQEVLNPEAQTISFPGD